MEGLQKRFEDELAKFQKMQTGEFHVRYVLKLDQAGWRIERFFSLKTWTSTFLNDSCLNPSWRRTSLSKRSVLKLLILNDRRKVRLTWLFGLFKELDLLKTDDSVYKLIGPILIKQDLTEATQTVQKRIDYIQGEMWALTYLCSSSLGLLVNLTWFWIFRKRLDGAIKDIDEKQESVKENLGKLQQQVQQAKVKMAMKA